MDTILNKISDQINESIEVKRSIFLNDRLIFDISKAVSIIIEAYESNHKTLFTGNGGSAADAQHLAGEFVGRFYFDRPGLASVALTTNTSILTSVGNDYGFEKIFARQVYAQGCAGDVFIGLSTSGDSVNVIEALTVCKEIGIKTIGLTGQTGGKMAELCDVCLRVPSMETPRIQESHIMIGHIICCLVEDHLFNHLKPIK